MCPVVSHVAEHHIHVGDVCGVSVSELYVEDFMFSFLIVHVVEALSCKGLKPHCSALIAIETSLLQGNVTVGT